MPFRAAADSAFAGTLPSQLRDLVNADLDYSGYFNVIDPDDLPPDWVERVQRVGNTFDTLRTFAGSDAARVQGTLTLGWEGVSADIAIFQPRIATPMTTRQFRFCDGPTASQRAPDRRLDYQDADGGRRGASARRSRLW